MKKTWSRLCAVLSSGAVLAGLSAVSGQMVDAAVSGPTQVKMFTSPVATVVNINTNWFTKYVEKKFNMKIHWVQVPSSDVQTKESLILQSGNYPDVFWFGSFTPLQDLQYGQQGIFVPLNHLLKTYAPNVMKVIQSDPGFKQLVTAPDGNIYGLPWHSWCLHCNWSAKMWINQHELSKLGLKMPRTTGQFKHVLEVFKKHGLDPLTGSTDGWHSNPVTFLMNAFIYDDESDYFFINSKGKLDFAAAQPQWKQGLEYIQGLYREGLIDHGAFTQNNDILDRQVDNLKVGTFPWGCKQCVISNYGTPQSHFTWWTTVPPLVGPHGVNYAAFFPYNTTSSMFAITNKANPAEEKAVISLLNFTWSLKGTETMVFGPEGKYWTYAKPGQKGMMGTPAIFNSNFTEIFGTKLQNVSWNQMGTFNEGEKWRYGQVAFPPNSFNGSEEMLQLETEKNYAGHQPKLVYPGFSWIPPAQVQQFSMYQTNIDNYVKQWTDEFIVGSKSISRDWNAYLQGLKGLGLQQYLSMTQKYMGKPFNTSSYQSDKADVKFLESLK